MSTEIEVKYNILRGDYYRLSKKLDYYESGKAFEDLNKEHDKEIHSLQYKLKQSERDYEKLLARDEKNIKEIDRLRQVIHDKDDEAEELIREYRNSLNEYKKLIDELKKQIDDLNGKVKKMSAHRMNRKSSAR